MDDDVCDCGARFRRSRAHLVSCPCFPLLEHEWRKGLRRVYLTPERFRWPRCTTGLEAFACPGRTPTIRFSDLEEIPTYGRHRRA